MMERAMFLSKGTCIQAEDISLPNLCRVATAKTHRALKEQMAEMESVYLKQLLTLHNNNVTKAAQEAGLHRRAFYQLLYKHHISAFASAKDRRIYEG